MSEFIQANAHLTSQTISASHIPNVISELWCLLFPVRNTENMMKLWAMEQWVGNNPNLGNKYCELTTKQCSYLSLASFLYIHQNNFSLSSLNSLENSHVLWFPDHGLSSSRKNHFVFLCNVCRAMLIIAWSNPPGVWLPNRGLGWATMFTPLSELDHELIICKWCWKRVGSNSSLSASA